jgi:tetratricopeptide (TPR) repeat protein
MLLYVTIVAARMCGEHGQAITLFMDQCLPVYKECLGDHPWVATLLNYISDSHQVMGCLEKAIDYNKQSLYIRVKLLGEHQDTARSYVHLGELFLEQENMEEALGAFKKALAIQEKVLGIHEETTATCQAVQDILFKLKMDEEGEEMRERAASYSTEVHRIRALQTQISQDIKNRANSRAVSAFPTINVRLSLTLIVVVALLGIFMGWLLCT